MRFAFALALLGCSSSPPMMEADASIGCRADPQAELVSAGMKKRGAELTFVLEALDPSPPARGNGRWTVRVEKSGAPRADATLEVIPFMPKHGHGTSVTPKVTASGGAYTIEPVYLFMPGLWQVTLKATVDNVTDSAVFTFCVEG